MKPSIGKKFIAHAQNTNIVVDGIRARALIIDAVLYDSYLEQYSQSQRLALAMQTVLQHNAHRLLMQESRVLRYRIPDEEAFAEELTTYRAFLNSFNPHAVDVMRDGRVCVPLPTARALHFMAAYNRELVQHVLESVLTTEYLRRFTDLKRAGLPYDGPTALQEAVDVLMAYNRTAKVEGRIRAGRDWPRFDT